MYRSYAVMSELLSTCNTGAYPFVFQRFSEQVGVIAAISEELYVEFRTGKVNEIRGRVRGLYRIN